MDEKFDVFIAYHGSERKGSEAQARMLYERIKDIPLIGDKKNLPYFHPAIARFGSFTATPEIVMRTPLFLLVVNKDIPRDGMGLLMQKRNDGRLSPLYQEVCAFRDSMYERCTDIGVAAKLFITDDFSHTQARQLHHIFAGTIALSTENEVIDWIQDFYQNRYPSVLYNQFESLSKRSSRDDWWRSDWAEEAEFYWKNCRVEDLGRCLLIFYCFKYQDSAWTDRVALEKVHALYWELLHLQQRSDLQQKTLEALTFVKKELNM